MTNNISARHIFLFLSDQTRWQNEADLNGNGEITKGEMREYLSSSDFEDFCGVKINDVSAKVFNEFWSAVDANVGNEKLDEKELVRIMLQMEAIKEVNNFIDKKNSDIPTELKGYSELWNDELANVFNTKIMEYVKSIGFDKTTLDDAMKAEIHSFLEEAYPEAKKQAAVQCYIQKYTDDNANNAEIKALKEYGYLLTDDKDLQRIIQQWINKNQDIDFNNINESIKQLIEGYLKTANIGNGSVDVLEGNSAYKPSRLNELQTAKLKLDAKNAFGASLKNVASSFSFKGANGNINLTDGKYEDIYKKYIDKFLDDFCTSGYKKVSTTNFSSLFDAAVNEIKKNGMNLFKTSQFAKDFETEVVFADNYRYMGKDFSDKVIATGISGDATTAGSDFANLQDWLSDDCGKVDFPEYYNAYNKILNALLDSYNTDYRNSDGSINYGKISNELLNIIKTKFGLKVNNSNNEEASKTAKTNINWLGFSNDSTKYNCEYLLFADGKLGNVQKTDISLAYLYNNGGSTGRLSLLKCTNWGFAEKGDGIKSVATAKGNLAAFVDFLSSTCSSSGDDYDASALATAAQKVKNVYNEAFNHALNNWASKKESKTSEFLAEDGKYSYTVKKFYYNSTSTANSSEGGELGLVIAESYHEGDFQITVDPRKVMDLFAKFYQQALGA